MSIQIQDKQQILDQFEGDGYTILRNVIDAELINEVNDHIAWLQAKHPDVRSEAFGRLLMRDDPFWVRLISDDRLVDIAQPFVGPDIALFASHYISKPPFTGKAVHWHQDGAHWPLQPMEVVTLWLAVDHSTPENGCVRIVPGSHKMELAETRPSTADNALQKEIAVEVDESQALDMVLAPGDVEVHHPNIVHGSNANTSPNRRCGLTIRYIPTSTKITSDEQPWLSAFHLRGAPGVNDYQPFPSYVDGQHMPFRGSTQWT